jgi:alginate O-acetyltransferase complex protein AlgI
MAIGIGRMLGFRFLENFAHPYAASSVQDFWRRWHISLSTWLRDYMYIPLGGSRLGTRRTYGNLMATMLLGGLWHGANWTFVVWGGLHGCWLSVERIFRREESSRFNPLGWTVTMIVVGVSWLLFRARSLTQAVTMLSDLGTFEWRTSFPPMLTYLGLIGTAALLIDLRLERSQEEYLFEKMRPEVAIATAAVLSAVTVLLGPMDTNAFIYFQF